MHRYCRYLRGDKPLPDMYCVKAEVAEDVPRIAQEIENRRRGNGQIRAGNGGEIAGATHWLRTAGIVLVFAIGLAAVFLIATTIRLTVFARRKAIGIMKLVERRTGLFAGLSFGGHDYRIDRGRAGDLCLTANLQSTCAECPGNPEFHAYFTG